MLGDDNNAEWWKIELPYPKRDRKKKKETKIFFIIKLNNNKICVK